MCQCVGWMDVTDVIAHLLPRGPFDTSHRGPNFQGLPLRQTRPVARALSLARARTRARARARSLRLQPRLPRPARHRAKTVTGTVGRTRRRGGRPSAWAVELGVLCKGTIDSAFENACRGLGDPSLRLCHVRVPGQHHLSSFILDLRRGYVAPDDLVQVGPPSIVRAKR